MKRVMLSRLTLAILIWKSNEMIQPDEKALGQGTDVILRVQSGRLDIGLVKIGKICVVSAAGIHNGLVIIF